MTRPSESPTHGEAHPRVAVVIPAYEAERTIGSTIASVLGQTLADFELIVVDDGSRDRTPELVSEIRDPRITLIRQTNGGTAAARNTGVRATDAELVGFVDNDDLWMPDYLERMVAALDADPAAGLAYTDAWVLDDVSKRIRRITELEIRPAPAPGCSQPDVLRALVRDNFVMSSVTIRRSALDATGGFDTAVRGTDDYDLWLRIMLAGFTLAGIGAPPALIQRHRPDSQSRDVAMMLDNVIVTLERLRDSASLDPSLRPEVERRIDEIRAERRLSVPTTRYDRLRSAARGRLGAARRALVARDAWPQRPPAEVARAFGDLRDV